ncbi:MAG: methylenetetrahydrofolate reductase, partial [Eggerthellaceae bacterium]|nr:methylenetetrahydrofolate reductase [Eggerthellaceae bacterium]
MKTVEQIINSKEQTISLEIFPPKGDFTYEAVCDLASRIAPLKPDFVSVTCSAGGSGAAEITPVVAGVLQNDYGLETVAHVTCVSASKETINDDITALRENNIQNVLALRGDLVDGEEPKDFRYAVDLIPHLLAQGFCVGAAAYPEGHISVLDEDIN